MIQMEYASSFSSPGPWLLDRASLEALDAIFQSREVAWNAQLERLILAKAEQRIARIGQEVSEERRAEILKSTEDDSRPSEKRVTVYLTGNRMLRGSTLKELTQSPAVASENPTGFEIKVESELGSLTLSTNKFFAASIDCSAYKRKSETETGLDDLRDWIEKFQTPLWVRLYSKYSLLFWFGLMLVSILGGTWSDTSSARRLQVATEAQRLINKGVRQENVSEAVELLLRIEAGLPIGETKPVSLPFWYKALLVLMSVAAVLFSFKPGVVIGIGRGARRLLAWQSYLRFAGITLPGLLLSAFAWPWLQKMIVALVS